MRAGESTYKFFGRPDSVDYICTVMSQRASEDVLSRVEVQRKQDFS